MAPSSTSNGGRQRSASRTLPTRKSKAAAAASSGSNAQQSVEEARQHESPGNNDDHGENERMPSSPGEREDDGVTNGGSATKGAERAEVREMQPAFNLNVMATIDHPSMASGAHRHPSPGMRRSPSPSKGTVVSRRGRSRSPVGMTPHPSSSRHSSRSTSRAGSRPGSNTRPGSRSSGRASAATVQASGGKELSDAALAAGEAAAGVVAVEHHMANGGYHHGPPPQGGMGMGYPPRGRSPSPVVGRFPSGSMSFEISPQQSMSFCNPEGGVGGGDSFDWNVGPGGGPGGPPPHGSGPGSGQQHHWHPSYQGGPPPGYPPHHSSGRRSPSPSRYPNDYPRDGGRYPDHRDQPPRDDRDGHGRYHPHPHHDPRHAPAYSTYHGPRDERYYRDYHGGRSPSPPPPPGPYPDHPARYHDQGRYHHPRGRSPSPRPGDLPRRNSQQALFPEHNVHGYDHPGAHPPQLRSPSKHTRSRSSGSRSRSRSRAQSPSKAPGRSSVFRGSPTPGKDNLPQELLLALEEEDDDETPPSSPNKTARKTINDAKEGKQGAKKGAKGSKKSKAVKRKSLGRESSTTTAHSSLGVPSMLDNQQIDAVLQDSMMLNADDYLTANLSFRKSYDLEQVFSFIKDGQGGLQGDIPLGNMSFNLGFSESRSREEEGDEAKRGKELPTLHTLRSQSMGLTPINSFSDANKGGIAPAASIDGGMLRAFFSSSPTTTGGAKPASPKGPSAAENAPVVHASTPPSYGGGQYPPREPRGMGGKGYSAHTPPQAGYRYRPHGSGGPIHQGFPNKRIRLSTRHCLHPTAADLPDRAVRGDCFALLRKVAPAFGGFRFKLLEMESGGDGAGEVGSSALNVVSHDTPPGPNDGRPRSESVGPKGAHGMMKPNDVQMSIARRRIHSSICAFGGSLPPRTVSPSPSMNLPTINPSAKPNAPSSAIVSGASTPSTPMDVGAAITEEERALALKEEEEERQDYEEQLSGRYFMKEHCISWDVELHEVIAPKVMPGAKGKKAGGKGVAATPKTTKAKQIGSKKPDFPPGKYCAPVTPHTPKSPPGNGADSKAPGTPGTPALKKTLNRNPSLPPGTPGGREKGAKIKYRCKLCGQPKQNHTCPYQSRLVRSIGTMVYPAVNAFVSNEPGRLAPPLSEMNNFTSLLSQDTTAMSHAGSHPPPPGAPHGPYRPYNVMTPDTSHWSPNTPGGLSTMSSSDHNSPGSVNGKHNSPLMGNLRKRDGSQVFMSRTMTRTMSGPPPPPPAPAGAIPSDVLFRDTMQLQREQFRTVRAVTTTVTTTVTSTTAIASPAASGSAPNPIESPNAYRYPAIPTPYSQRKELGDTLFALSREVPKLADSFASILREARESDAWDQAVAELTTQVLVVLKCDEGDYSLEGLRRHLLTLGIAC